MVEQVYIETEASLEDVQSALTKNGITVSREDSETAGTLVASVPDSRDAEDEVTDALNDAGIVAYVELVK